MVVAYNDSGSFFETFAIPVSGLSLNGYSRSIDAGRTFVDRGYLNPGTNGVHLLAGDPVVTCTDENTFYQSSIFEAVDLRGASVGRGRLAAREANAP